ncbi:MAG: S41 family peptidase [Actinomycetota bacterium]
MFKKLVIKIIAILVAVIFVFSTGFWLGINFYTFKDFTDSSASSLMEVTDRQDSGQREDQPFSLKPLEEAIELITSSSIYDPEKEELLRYAIEGMLEGLGDRHAEYFTQEEYEQIMESYSGTMSGIGVVVTLDEDEKVVIVNVIEGTPAQQEGLKEQDIITEVEGEPIQGFSLEKVVSMIKGEEGTSVNLTIYRPSQRESFEIDITRQRFYIPNIFAEMLEDDIGYIQYIGFQRQGAQKLNQEIEELVDSGASGLILDLRNNLGGILNDAVDVCDVFLDEGTIVTVEGRNGDSKSISTFEAKKGGYTEIPLVVLINGFSASASELAAGALKENGRATLVGETSFGKGTVQTIQELSDGSGLKFTTAKYFLPSGRSIEGRGIIPDVSIALDMEAEEDLQLEKALETIKEMIGSGDG